MTRRILSAEISHETNTFSILPTTIPLYQARRYYRGQEIRKALAGTSTEIGAHLDAAKKYGWVLAQPIAAAATPGGKTPARDWDRLRGAVVEACQEGPFDGVLLALHGAMVTEDQDDAEGDLLCHLRERLGPNIPIAITLDIHANVTQAMASLANIVVAYRTYPHVDQYARAMEAAALLQGAMEGEVHPRALIVRGPQIDGCDYGRTQGGPMSRILCKAEELRKKEPGVLAVAVCAGFVWADIPEAGPSVTVTGDGESSRYRALAEKLQEEIWATRAEKTVSPVTLEEAMDQAKAVLPESKPLVIADYTDNPGSGGYGDGVRLLRAMIEASLPNAALASVADPEAVRKCVRAGRGARVKVELGAKIDPKTYGPPLVFEGIVENMSDGAYICEGPMSKGVLFSLGPTVVLRRDGVRAVVATHNHQVYDLQIFRSQNVEPRECSVLAVKSWHHFRAAFEPISSGVLLADSGGLASMDLTRFTYRKVRRPVWPLDNCS